MIVAKKRIDRSTLKALQQVLGFTGHDVDGVWLAHQDGSEHFLGWRLN